MAGKGANLHHKHGAGSRGAGRMLGSGAGLCALGVGEEVDGAVARTAGSERGSRGTVPEAWRKR